MIKILDHFQWNRLGMVFSDNGKDRKCAYVNQAIRDLIQAKHTTLDIFQLKTDGAVITDEEIDTFLEFIRTRSLSMLND